MGWSDSELSAISSIKELEFTRELGPELPVGERRIRNHVLSVVHATPKRGLIHIMPLIAVCALIAANHYEDYMESNCQVSRLSFIQTLEGILVSKLLELLVFTSLAFQGLDGMDLWLAQPQINLNLRAYTAPVMLLICAILTPFSGVYMPALILRPRLWPKPLSLSMESPMTATDHYNWNKVLGFPELEAYPNWSRSERCLGRQQLKIGRSHDCGYSSLLYHCQQYSWSEENTTSFMLDMWVTIFPYDVINRKSTPVNDASSPYYHVNLDGRSHLVKRWTAIATLVQDPEPQIQRQMDKSFPGQFFAVAKEYVIPIPPLYHEDGNASVGYCSEHEPAFEVNVDLAGHSTKSYSRITDGSRFDTNSRARSDSITMPLIQMRGLTSSSWMKLRTEQTYKLHHGDLHGQNIARSQNPRVQCQNEVDYGLSMAAMYIYVLTTAAHILRGMNSSWLPTTSFWSLRPSAGMVTSMPKPTTIIKTASIFYERHVLGIHRRKAIKIKLLSRLQTSASSIKRMASTVGLFEPELASEMKRLLWSCACGVSSFDDFNEPMVGHLEDHPDEPSGRNAPNTKANNDHELPSQGVSTIIPYLRRLFGRQRGTDQLMGAGTYLPRHNLAQSHVLTVANPLRLSTEPLYLLVCMHADSASKKLAQLPIESLEFDRELFRLLNKAYLSRRGRLQSVFSMQKLCGIHFVKFSLLSTKYVDVHQHETLCKSTCGCLPPREKIDDAEYKYYPIPPERSPPIGPNWMAHLTGSPRCVPEGQTWMLTQIPKKLKRELQGSLHNETLGWGLYLQEGLNWSKIWTFMLVVFVTGSLAFGILWTVFKNDIQGAFGVAGWLISLCTILVGFVATRDMV